MAKIKILIVEDETIVAFDIEGVLESLGYEVTDAVVNYDEALKSVNNKEPDIILMDINLENSKDGIQIAEAINQIKAIPIIYLTAYSDDATIQRAAQTNPVGYLTKPFKKDDIKSTIILGLHKIKQIQNSQLTQSYLAIGENYRYDIKNSSLYYDNIPIKLSTKERLLLNILVEAKGNIVTFETLEHQIWSDKTVASGTFRVLVYRLRSKLDHKYIETIPNFGCRLLF